MANYRLFGQELVISDAVERNFDMDERLMNAWRQMENDFDNWYKKCSGIESVLRSYDDMAGNILFKYGIEKLYGDLAKLDIFDVSKDRYIDKCIDLRWIDDALDRIEADYEEIVEDQEEMREYRAARKASRGRMVGGGFGMSGAIKGAMQAGAINATTGMAHSIGNAIGNAGSAIAASAKKSALYSNSQTKGVLLNGVRKALMAIYENHKTFINSKYRGYFESGFDRERAKALFQNAKNIPEKRTQLLYDAVKLDPANEDILSYIFLNYEEEQKNAYIIGQRFRVDLGVYIEKSFSSRYEDMDKGNAVIVEGLKNELLSMMKEYGIKSSDTLNKINHDELIRIAEKYYGTGESKEIEAALDEFQKYDALENQKAEVVKSKGIWEIAAVYNVQFSTEETESILSRYYTNEARNDEEEAQQAKKKIMEIMKSLGVETSATFDRLEKDCVGRLCNGLVEADEAMCNSMKENVEKYDALSKNKAEYFDAIQNRIEQIWSKEDGEIFDNVYMNTDIHSQDKINEALEFIRQKGRTASAQKYISALEACNEKNINNAKKYQKKSTKTSRTVGIVLVISGAIALFVFAPVGLCMCAVGAALMIRYNKLKKNWNILTIDGTQIHNAIISVSVIEEKPMEQPESQDEKTCVCTACGAKLEENVKFCPVCGAKAFLECPKCKSRVKMPAKFCAVCGEKLTDADLKK